MLLNKEGIDRLMIVLHLINRFKETGILYILWLDDLQISGYTAHCPGSCQVATYPHFCLEAEDLLHVKHVQSYVY